MSRQVEVGAPVSDHFPVYEDDGVTKHPGLTAIDFQTHVFWNSAVSAAPVLVQEIGSTGEYKYTFTPTSPGDWDVQIRCLYNDDVWADEYDAVGDLVSEIAPLILDQCKKIDLAPTETPANAVSGSLMDRMMNKSSSKTYNQSTDSMEAVRDELEIIKALLHHNAIIDMHTYTGGLLTSARLRMFDTAAHVPVTEGGGETAGLVAQFAIESSYDMTGLNKKFTLKRVLP